MFIGWGFPGQNIPGSKIRIALTSGYMGEDVDQMLSDSPWPFLRKPYSAEALRNLVEGRAPQGVD